MSVVLLRGCDKIVAFYAFFFYRHVESKGLAEFCLVDMFEQGSTWNTGFMGKNIV